MLNALYKSTALSALVLVGIAYVGMAQPSFAYSTGPTPQKSYSLYYTGKWTTVYPTNILGVAYDGHNEEVMCSVDVTSSSGQQSGSGQTYDPGIVQYVSMHGSPNPLTLLGASAAAFSSMKTSQIGNAIQRCANYCYSITPVGGCSQGVITLN